MKLFIMRHGEASQTGPDLTRSLTPRGRRDVERTAKFLRRCKAPISNVWHSSKTRAFETAQILTKELGSQTATEARAGLDPGDSVEDFVEELRRDAPDGLLVVGHLPFVDKLVGHLTAEGKAAPITFKTGTLAALEGDFHGAFFIAWVLTPDILAE